MLVALYMPQGLAGLAQKFRKPQQESADE
jgi:hypothetical protein